MDSVLKVISLFNRLTATPFSLEANALIEKGDFQSLVARKVHPNDYRTPSAYFQDAQVQALVSKLAGLPTGVDLEQAALDSFYESERKCAETNRKLAPWINALERGLVSDWEGDHAIMGLITRIRARVASVLGEIPKMLCPSFGNGATYGDRGKKTTICHKMASHPTVTREAVAYLDLIRGTAWWTASDKAPVLTDGNRFFTVPKDSEKHRGAATEPSVNLSLQLAIAKVVRSRLLAVTGIDIQGSEGTEAQRLHKYLAGYGSLHGDLISTLDLRSASDTICLNLVRLLLPKRWFQLFNDLRSPATFIEGKWVQLEKFSSMGNGFTFELETLLFWAISSELGNGWARVYGDDILVTTNHYDNVVAGLKFFGFTPNDKKSFSTGAFRESCGGDYFAGVDVRPVFIKTMPSNPEEWIVFHNLIVGAARKMGFHEDEVESLSVLARGPIPIQYRLFGPSTCAGVLHSPQTERWSLRVKDGITCVRALQPLPTRIPLRRFPGAVQLASALLGAPSKGVTPRNSVAGWKRGWVSVS